MFFPGPAQQISLKQGPDTADKKLKEAESEGKVIIKDVIADAFYNKF